jgi:hypothetical protein
MRTFRRARSSRRQRYLPQTRRKAKDGAVSSCVCVTMPVRQSLCAQSTEAVAVYCGPLSSMSVCEGRRRHRRPIRVIPSRVCQARRRARMSDDRCRPGAENVVIGLDLASTEHQAVVLTADGRRVTRLKVPHPRAGIRRIAPAYRSGGLGACWRARVCVRSDRPATSGRRLPIASRRRRALMWS